jgi:hypothetical protein
VLEQTAALTGRLSDRIESVLVADPAGLQPGDQQAVDERQVELSAVEYRLLCHLAGEPTRC